MAFGTAYGVLIKELRLLTRAVFVVDRAGVVRQRQFDSLERRYHGVTDTPPARH